MHQPFVLTDVTNAGSRRRETGSYRKIYLMIIALLSVREKERNNYLLSEMVMIDDDDFTKYKHW